MSDPYGISGGVLNPPWTFVLLSPLALLPGRFSGGALAFLSAMAVVAYARSPWKVMAICASAPFVFVIILGQLDGLVLYGFVLPVSLSALMILIKPQGALLVLLNRLNRKMFIGLGVGTLISLALWGFWPGQMLRLGLNPDPMHNASLFPFNLPLAPFLIYYGLRRKSDALLCWATLCIMPFFQTHSMLPAIATSIYELEDWRGWVAIPLISWGYYVGYLGWVN